MALVIRQIPSALIEDVDAMLRMTRDVLGTRLKIAGTDTHSVYITGACTRLNNVDPSSNACN